MFKRDLLFAIIVLTIGFVSSAGIEPKVYYRLDLDYYQGDVIIKNVDITFAEKEIVNYLGTLKYAAEVKDYKNNTLKVVFFDFPTEVYWDDITPETGNINGSYHTTLDNSSINLFVPYYKSAKEITIYNKNLNKLDKISISEYSAGIERAKILEEKGIAEIETEEEKEAKKPEEAVEGEKLIEKLANYWWALLAVLIVLVIILIKSLEKK